MIKTYPQHPDFSEKWVQRLRELAKVQPISTAAARQWLSTPTTDITSSRGYIGGAATSPQ